MKEAFIKRSDGYREVVRGVCLWTEDAFWSTHCCGTSKLKITVFISLSVIVAFWKILVVSLDCIAVVLGFFLKEEKE